MVQVRSSIFWPRCASDSPSGFVIGWNPHSFLCSIATVASNVRLDELERVLAEVAHAQPQPRPSASTISLSLSLSPSLSLSLSLSLTFTLTRSRTTRGCSH